MQQYLKPKDDLFLDYLDLNRESMEDAADNCLTNAIQYNCNSKFKLLFQF